MRIHNAGFHIYLYFFSYNNYDSMPPGQNSSDYGKSNYGSQANQGKGSNASTGGEFLFIFYLQSAVLRIRMRDLGLGAFLTPGSGMGESQHPDPGSGMNIPDHILYSLEINFLLFLGLKYLNSLRIRDPGWR
jgi:hypothetical protein